MGAISGVAYTVVFLIGSQLATLVPISPGRNDVSSLRTGCYNSLLQPKLFNLVILAPANFSLQLRSLQKDDMTAYKPPNRGGPTRGTKGTGTRFQALTLETTIAG